MSAINLATGIRTGTQIPLDDKLYVKTLSELIDLGTDNYKAFTYYDGMQVLCIENDIIYMWKEVSSTGGIQVPGEMPDDFEYPSGSISNGIDYSGKLFNFFKYYQVPAPQTVGDKIFNGSVYWIGGLNFRSTPISFKFNGLSYNVPVTNKTISDAHATLNRIDVFAVTNNSELIVIEGTPAETPQEPNITFASQLRIAAVYIPAGETEPQNATTDTIYDENLGQPNEWNTSSEIFGTGGVPPPITSVVFNSTNDPDKNTKSIEATNIPSDVQLNFIRQSAIAVAGISSLFFRFKSKIRKDYSINIKIFGPTKLLSSLTLNPNNFGFNPLNTSSYTDVNIPLSAFVNSGNVVTTISKITISFGYNYTGTPGLPSFFMDDIKFILGGENPLPKNSFYELNEVLEKNPKSAVNKFLKFDENGNITAEEINYAGRIVNFDITTDQTADTLNSLYPLAEDGFEVFCPNIVSAPKKFIRVADDSKWIEFTGVALIPS